MKGLEPPACWDGRWRIVSTLTGESFPAGCARLSCAECAPLHRRRLARAMRRAQPAQLVTLTRVGDDWQTIRARMARVRHRLKAVSDVAVDWAWTVERNPRGTGHHVHAAKRGTWLSHAALTHAARREGVGHVWVSPASSVGAPERYLTKYLGKGVREWSAYLALNGDRLIHTTRGFWLDDQGDACTWRIARRGDGTWVRVRIAALTEADRAAPLNLQASSAS